MFVLDTNVVSELRKLGDGRADARVIAWISGQDAASFYISALTLIWLDQRPLRIRQIAWVTQAAAGGGLAVCRRPHRAPLQNVSGARQ